MSDENTNKGPHIRMSNEPKELPIAWVEQIGLFRERGCATYWKSITDGTMCGGKFVAGIALDASELYIQIEHPNKPGVQALYQVNINELLKGMLRAIALQWGMMDVPGLESPVERAVHDGINGLAVLLEGLAQQDSYSPALADAVITGTQIKKAMQNVLDNRGQGGGAIAASDPDELTSKQVEDIHRSVMADDAVNNAAR